MKFYIGKKVSFEFEGKHTGIIVEYKNGAYKIQCADKLFFGIHPEDLKGE